MDNKSLVKVFCQRLWEQRDLSVVDEFFMDDAKIYSPFNVKYGALTMKEIAEKWLTAFPDLLLNWQDIISDDGKVVVRWQAEGTHMGSFLKQSQQTMRLSTVALTYSRLKRIACHLTGHLLMCIQY